MEHLPRFQSSLKRTLFKYYIETYTVNSQGTHCVFKFSKSLDGIPILPQAFHDSCPFFRKIFILSWFGLPFSLTFKVQSQEFRSLAMENESQVCSSSAFVRWTLDGLLEKKSFSRTWQTVSDTAATGGDKEREETVDTGSFVWKLKQDAR